jgi:hypothetical protein
MTPPSRRCEAGSDRDRAREQRGPAVVDDELGAASRRQRGLRVGELVAQLGQRDERCAERRQLARADLASAMREAMRSTSACVRSASRSACACVVGTQRGDRSWRADAGRVAQRARQPLAQQAAAGRAAQCRAAKAAWAPPRR